MTTTFINNRKPWKPDEEATLLEFMRNSDKTLREVSDAIGRTPMAILLRTRILVGIDALTKAYQSCSNKNKK